MVLLLAVFSANSYRWGLYNFIVHYTSLASDRNVLSMSSIRAYVTYDFDRRGMIDEFRDNLSNRIK